jgi:hypothetical protein
MKAKTLTLAQCDCQNFDLCTQPLCDEVLTRMKSTPQCEGLQICLGIVPEVDPEEAGHRVASRLRVNVKEQ